MRDTLPSLPLRPPLQNERSVDQCAKKSREHSTRTKRARAFGSSRSVIPSSVVPHFSLPANTYQLQSWSVEPHSLSVVRSKTCVAGMSLFHTPHVVKTRAQKKKDQLANVEGRQLEFKSDLLHSSTDAVKKVGKAHSDIGLNPLSSSLKLRRQDGGECKSSCKSRATSSSAIRRQQLEYEAAQVKAKIEMEEIQTMARIEKELVDKKLAMDLAELESKSRCSNLSSSASCKSKVENWLEKSVAEPGTSHDGNKATVGGGECHRNIDGDETAIPPATATSTHRAIEELANAIKKAVDSSNSNTGNNVLLSRLATSKDLPLYFGDPLEWIQFREAFYESSRVCKYSDTENVWRLRKCLRGDAKDAAAALLMGASSPHDIIETLELRFGRPENVMRQVISQLKKLSPLPHSYHAEIVKFAIKIKNCVTAVTTLKQIDYLKSPELLTIVVSKLPTGLVSKWVEYLHENRVHTETPKLELLAKFLYEEAQKVAESGVSHIQYQNDFNNNKHQKKHSDRHSVLTSVKVSDPDTAGKCKFCKRNKHALPDCSQFKRAMRKDRWRFVKANNLCFKCLRARHPDKDECTAENCNVEACGGPHHQMLHWTKPEVARRETSAPPNDSASATPDSAGAAASELVSHASTAQCLKVSVIKPKTNVVLKIVPVTIHGPRSSVATHALLDDGATVTLIAADLADQVGLHGERVTMRASGAWDSELLCETEIIKCKISNSDGNKFNLRARKLKELNLPLQLFTSNVNYCEINSSNNNSIICDSNVKPKILIGQDNYDLIAPISCKRYKPGGPYITQTLLGWCVHGAWQADFTGKRAERVNIISSVGGAGGEPAAAHGAATSHLGKPAAHALRDSSPSNGSAGASGASCFDSLTCVDKPLCQSAVVKDTFECSTDIDLSQLHDLIRCSFSLDSIGISNKPRQNIEELRAVNILNESAELVNGQWSVKLPWKYDQFVMPDAYPVALKRLQSVERKMSSNSEYEIRYRERIEHLLKNNYARKLTEAECRFDSETNHVWYLPHFGVDNPNKKKLRLVFDAAAKSDNMSLNDFLLQGPDLLQSLYGIMFRFRENPIGIIGDIKDMFLRIKIHKSDQNAFRFLWKEKGSDVVNKYVMTSLIFGANCSPFVAQFINQNKNASRFSQQMPDAVKAIKNNQYMDDYIDSFSDEEVARKIIREISLIHSEGGFKMCNYLSNVPSVLCDIPKDSLNDIAIKFNFDKQAERALGILWFPRSDQLALDLSFKRIPQDIILLKRIPTKREMLSIVMSIFDIHGYLGPFTIKGKILMRETWKLNIKWDEKLNDNLYDLFCKWINQSKEINNIRIPRCYFSCDQTSDSLASLELHLFCDASPSAYAAAAYWRRESSDGQVTVSFIASKCKVTPLKPVSVPRLELQGAVLACKLANSVKREHRLQPNLVFYWTDSTTVLHWVKNNCRTYKAFIANRLGEIDELSRSDEWRYVPTGVNVADLATKNSDYVLTGDSEWFSGPSFLHQPRSCWPQQPEIKTISDEILEKVHVVQDDNIIRDLPVPEPRRFSSWLRLLRSTAKLIYCL